MLAFAHRDLRTYLGTGRQSPQNVFKGLKLDSCQAALKSLSVILDLSLTGFSPVTPDEAVQNQSGAK